MHWLFLCGCLAVVAAAPPASVVDQGEGRRPEAELTPQQQPQRQELTETVQYQDEPEYLDTLPRPVPVLLLTQDELGELLEDLQYSYGDGDLNEYIQDDYDNELLDGKSQEQENNEEPGHKKGDSVGHRSKRQVAQEAMNFALSHTDHTGANRPVGRIHGRFDLNGFRNNRNNHHTQAGLGLGSVVYRSNNGRHSVGVGAYGTQGRGSFQGYRYRTRPQWGAGIGYRFRF